MKTYLYGVGVGPGDPDLLTIKAKKIINTVDCLLIPVKEKGKESIAFNIIKDHLENEAVTCVELVYPMGYDKNLLEEAWKTNGACIDALIKDKKTCAFITLGDPCLYSTFMYTLPYVNMPKDSVEIIPGINAFSGLASTLKVSLAQWQEDLKVMPIQRKGVEALNAQIDQGQNIILMKPQKCTKDLVESLKSKGLSNSFRVVSNIGTSKQTIIENIETLERVSLPYLSTVLIKKGGFND